MKKITVYLFFALLLFVSQDVAATHFAGGDIEYEIIGVRKWKVTLTLYRFCDGASICSGPSNCTAQMTAKPSQNSQGGLNPQGCSGGQVNLTLSFVKVEDAEKRKVEICGNAAKNGCTNMGQVSPGTNKPGIEKYVFQGELNMSSPAFANVCPYYDISFSECCRNSTQNVQGQPGYAIVSTLNIHDRSATQALRNNSPKLTNEAIIVVCANEENILNVGAVDADGDSLTYEIIKSLTDANGGIVSYVPPFNEFTPFFLNSSLPPHNQYPGSAKIQLDNLTGDYSFNPMNINPNQMYAGDFSIRITQWNYNINAQTGARTPYVAGITMRNLQLYSVACLPNNPPKLETNPSLPNNKPKLNWSVCAGEQICFTVTAKDVDSSQTRRDSTFIIWNNGIVSPGKLSFVKDYDPTLGRPREDRWKFCWQTDTSDGRTLPYYFSVRADDNSCPNPGKILQTFSISVAPAPQISFVKFNSIMCGKKNIVVNKNNLSQTFQSAKLVVAKKPFDFSFSQGSDTITSSNPNPSVSMPKYIIADTLEFQLPGKYLVKLLIKSNSCDIAYYDTLTVDTLFKAFVSDTFKCKYSSVLLEGTFEGGTGPYTYRWYRNTTNGIPVNGPDYQTNKTYTAIDTVSTKYFLRIQDMMGCTALDSLMLQVKKIDSADIVKITNDQQCLTGNNFRFRVGALNNFHNHDYRWIYGDSIKTDSVISISYTTTGTKAISLIVNEAQGCSDTLTKTIRVTPMPETLNVITVNDSDQCLRGNAFSFNRTSLPSHTYTWFIDKVSSNNAGLQHTFISAGAKTVKLKIQNAAGCIDTSYQTVFVNAAPIPAIINTLTSDTQCITGNAFRFTRTYQPGMTYTWITDSNMDTDSLLTYSLTTPGSKIILLRTTEAATGCFDTLTKRIFVTPTPVIDSVILVNNPNQCVSNNSFSFTHTNTNNPQQFSHNWLYNGVINPASPFIISGLEAGTYTVKLLISQPKGCSDTALKTITVNKLPAVEGVISINLDSQCLYNNSYVFNYNPLSIQHGARWNINGEVYYATSTATHSFSTAGIKTASLTLTTAAGCSDSAAVSVFVKPAPATVSIAGKTTVKVDSTYTYSIVPNPDHSYKWNVTNGLFTESDTTATVTVKWTMTGNAKLNVIQNLSDCEDTTSINVVVDQLTGLSERSFSNYFSVIPNPNNGRFIININSESDHAQLMLYNSLGALVYSKDDVVSHEEINTQLSPGLYFIVLKNNSGSGMQKLMIR